MKSIGRLLAIAVISAITHAACLPAHATDVSGAGSTFVFPILTKWADAYKKATGVVINYQSVGSGAGIKQIKSKTVDFGASDAPLIPKELAASGLVQFPIVMGGVAPVLNIKGIGPGQLKLTGPVLADIFLGKITRWDDPDGRPGILTGNRPKRIQERLRIPACSRTLAWITRASRSRIGQR